MLDIKGLPGSFESIANFQFDYDGYMQDSSNLRDAVQREYDKVVGDPNATQDAKDNAAAVLAATNSTQDRYEKQHTDIENGYPD